MRRTKLAIVCLTSVLTLSGCTFGNDNYTIEEVESTLIVSEETSTLDVSTVELTEEGTSVSVNEGEYDYIATCQEFSVPIKVLDDGTPYYDVSQWVSPSEAMIDGYDYSDDFEVYNDLDELGRCTSCFVCIDQDLMPTEERGEIGSVKPSGWQHYDETKGKWVSNNNKYPGLVDGNYIYNRCHLIGYQLSGENALYENLITGTRYLNIDGMLWLENLLADYVEETNNRVAYYAEPYFQDDELVARGLFLLAYSVEDDGEDISYSIYVPNIQPGVTINYSDGTNTLSETE